MLNTQQTVRIALTFDPAIDVGKCLADPKALPKYIASRDMRDLEPLLRPNAQPQVFHLRHLDCDEVTYARAGGSADEMARRAFCLAVVQVDRAKTRDGAEITFKPAGKSIDKQDLDEHWRMCAVVEIGGVALARSFLDPSIGMPFDVPPSSAAILKHKISRHVEASTPTTSFDLSKPDSDAVPPISASGDEPSDKPGDAAATG